jgi:hypothetical protein
VYWNLEIVGSDLGRGVFVCSEDLLKCIKERRLLVSEKSRCCSSTQLSLAQRERHMKRLFYEPSHIKSHAKIQMTVKNGNNKNLKILLFVFTGIPSDTATACTGAV